MWSPVGTADVPPEAAAHGSVSAALALRVGAARVALARVKPAADVGVTDVLRGHHHHHYHYHYDYHYHCTWGHLQTAARPLFSQKAPCTNQK